MDYYGLMKLAFCLLASLLISPGAMAQAPKPVAPASAAAATAITSSALDAPLFYQLLLGELNVQGGEPGTGYSLILDAARKANVMRRCRLHKPGDVHNPPLTKPGG